ncbi:MAG: hypothetical protein HND58_10290 [Planctomycetota bacterium]|nr:MAG: hypothetical protein HND58_10290 [Planctomycetota bacterium]
MAFTPAPGEQFTVRRKVLKILGASFHVFDENGQVVAYCQQKAFKLREDIRLYTSESKTETLLTMKARSVIDFGVTFDITLPSGESIGSLRRKGLKSMFRDSWLLYSPAGVELATMREDSGTMAILRRLHEAFALLSPQKFQITKSDGTLVATLRTHFNLFVYRLGVSVHTEDEEVDELMVLAAACLIAAIEGRQSS